MEQVEKSGVEQSRVGVGSWSGVEWSGVEEGSTHWYIWVCGVEWSGEGRQ